LPPGHLIKEFVTIDYLGSLPGDPSSNPLGTRLFLNNVGGNGGGEGCCSGTTSYFPVEQDSPGAPFKQTAPQGMVDWGAFRLIRTNTTNLPANWTGLLDGDGSRGLSMARTLGSAEPDQVTHPGRRVLIGWTGGGDQAVFGGHGSTQSLPRELSLAPDRSLLQRFVPELQKLRFGEGVHMAGRSAWFPSNVSLQAEVVATLPPSCATAHTRCGVSVLGDQADKGVTVTLAPELGLVIVDGTQLGNTAVRAGPLPTPTSAGWSVHVIADHSIVEVIVNNATAFVVYAVPTSADAGFVHLVGTPSDPSGAQLAAWPLADAGHVYSTAYDMVEEH